MFFSIYLTSIDRLHEDLKRECCAQKRNVMIAVWHSSGVMLVFNTNKVSITFSHTNELKNNIKNTSMRHLS